MNTEMFSGAALDGILEETAAKTKKAKVKKPKPKAKAAKKVPKAKVKKPAAKKAKPYKYPKVKAKKLRKLVKKAVKKASKTRVRVIERPCRLDMRLSKAEKAKVVAKAKKLRRTVTSIVYEAIEKLK